MLTNTDQRVRLQGIRRFDQLVAYLRDELDWPIDRDDFEDLTFDFTPEELGIDPKTAARISEIKRLRPLSAHQPWGIFFVKFEPKRLPVVALRRILSQVALKKRASSNRADSAAWAPDDLLFISNYGEGDERQISLAHFSVADGKQDLPSLKVLGWNNLDTPLHLDSVADQLRSRLVWPRDEADADEWRRRWRSAFVVGHNEVVTTSRALAERLAALARGIRDRISSALAIETDRGPLRTILGAFQATLVHDLDENGFADMYAQTIAYGLLSARVSNREANTADGLASAMPSTNPFLRELLETFLRIGGRRNRRGGPGIDFDELGVSEVVELLDRANMEAVLRDFGDQNPDEDPVIHFYESFLREYDARRRMERGVFYTPRPAVAFIVRAIDRELRTRFNLEDGLADTSTWRVVAGRTGITIPKGVSPESPFVCILDPATGTGTFVVEVIDHIHRTMVARWTKERRREPEIAALWNDYVANHLLPRVYGYELLMAPYAIAHLKIGLKLHETGYDFHSNERARVFLTNALEPAHDFSSTFEFAIPALAHEAHAVSQVKRMTRFTVVMGNPPYSGVSSNRGEWINSLLHGDREITGSELDYYEVEGQPLGEKKLWLQDDYVKFIRLSHYLIEQSTVGVHGMITNHSYLDSPTCRGMRYQLLRSFRDVFALDLHGSTKRGEVAPDGMKDENLFDILPGVGILIASADGRSDDSPRSVRSFDLWGSRSDKGRWLRQNSVDSIDWTALPAAGPYFLFVVRQMDFAGEYDAYLPLPGVFPTYGTGIQTSRDAFATDADRDLLEKRLRHFLDLRVPDSKVREAYGLKDTRGWKVSEIRRSASSRSVLASIQPYTYRVFDTRWIALTKDVVDWPRLEVMNNLGNGRVGLLCSRQQSISGFRHALAVDAPVDMFCLSNKSREGQSVFPLFVKSDGDLFSSREQGEGIANIADQVWKAWPSHSGRRSSAPSRCSAKTASEIFNYVYAVLFCGEFRTRYEDLLKMDFPRIPYPRSEGLADELQRCGGRLVDLHLFRKKARGTARVRFSGSRATSVERIGWREGVVYIDAPASLRGSAHHEGSAGFAGVPEEVWLFEVGGYQVCEKWLKDRKGNVLTNDEIDRYREIVAVIEETLSVMSSIDEIVERHGGLTLAFSGWPK